MATEVTIKTNKTITAINKFTTIQKAAANIMNAMASEQLNTLSGSQEYIAWICEIKAWADGMQAKLVQSEIDEAYRKTKTA